MNTYEFRVTKFNLTKIYYEVDDALLEEISKNIKYNIGSFVVNKNKNHFIVKLIVENGIEKNAATNSMTCVIPIIRSIPEMEKLKAFFHYSTDPLITTFNKVIDKGNNLQSKYNEFAIAAKEELDKELTSNINVPSSPLLGYYPNIVLQHLIRKLQPDNVPIKLFETLWLTNDADHKTWILQPKNLINMKLYVFVITNRFLTKGVKYDDKNYIAPYKIFQECNPKLKVNYEAKELFQDVNNANDKAMENFLNQNKSSSSSDSNTNNLLKDRCGFPDRTIGQYKLIAAITHEGYLPDNDGHYITYCRHNDESSYFWKYDDTVVSEVTEDELISLQGGSLNEMIYIALYKCVK